jgi:membrane protein YdbS with pleckstrin-like domain
MMKVISIAGMIGTLALAYGLDRLLESFRQTAARTSDIAPVLWLMVLANLLVAASVLMLAWFVDMKSKKSILVSAIFLVTGVLLLLSVTPSVMVPLSYLPDPFRLFQPSPNSLLYRTGAFITVIGILGLIARPRA